MITDPIPRKLSHREEFIRSDQTKNLAVPENDRLRVIARAIEAAMQP